MGEVDAKSRDQEARLGWACTLRMTSRRELLSYLRSRVKLKDTYDFVENYSVGTFAPASRKSSRLARVWERREIRRKSASD